MNRAEASNNAVTPQTLEGLQEALHFQDWPLKEQFIPGFSPKVVLKSAVAEYRLDRETLAPLIGSWVDRSYFYSHSESRSAFNLSVIVGQKSARDGAQGLLLQLFYTEMHIEPRVELSAPRFGDVTIYRHADAKQSIAFIRNNVAISVENYSSGRKPVDVERIANLIDGALQESPKVPDLAAHFAVPVIRLFEPASSVVHPGERADLKIEVSDNHPPLEFQLRAENGSYNLDPTRGDFGFYFRAGETKGKAEVILRVVNDVNLAAESRCSITIE